MKTFEVTQNTRMWLHSQPSPHENCLADDASVDDVRGGVLETERVEQSRQEEAAGAEAWALGSPSFARTWRQKELRQYPCFEARCGSTKVEVSIGRERNQEDHEEVRCLFGS